MSLDQATLDKCCQMLLDSGRNIAIRFRALFALRNHPDNELCQQAIAKSIQNEPTSHLLRHEAAYCLGQMQAYKQIEFFKEIVADLDDNAMVRHEAAEALGVLGANDISVQSFLHQFLEDKEEIVRHTCELALQRIEYFTNDQKTQEGPSKFESFDPTPPHPSNDVTILSQMMGDYENVSLFDRYRAMMKLRDLSSDQSIKSLCDEMAKDTNKKQALFRHELAFVLGQLRNPAAIAALISTLANLSEHYVVRHESAFALGCIAHESAKNALVEFSKDPDLVVSESCIVGLDMINYMSGDDFNITDELLRD